MSDPLLEAFRHSAWANRKLVEFCRGLSDEQLTATAAGTYGSVLATIQHIIGAESYYVYLVAGRSLAWPDFDEADPQPPRWALWLGDLAAFWEETLASPVDADKLFIRHDGGGWTREVRAGVVLAQALHHANVHREQVCTIVTSLGIEPPDLDVWVYGGESGRDTMRAPGT